VTDIFATSIDYDPKLVKRVLTVANNGEKRRKLYTCVNFTQKIWGIKIKVVILRKIYTRNNERR